MTEHQTLRIVITGDYRHHEHAAEFNGMMNEPNLLVTPMGWSELADTRPVADLVVVAQSRRGQFRQADIDQLAEMFPLAARVVVFGSWCEGETRSGAPLQSIHRVWLRDWANVLHQVRREFIATGTTCLHATSTFSRVDVLLGQPSEMAPVPPLDIVVQGNCGSFLATTAEFCATRDWNSASLKIASRCDVAICDCYYSIEEAIRFAEPLSKKFGTVPLVAVCGFPRSQDRQLLAKTVARSTILGKPFDNNDLEAALIRLVQNGELNLVSDVA